MRESQKLQGLRNQIQEDYLDYLEDHLYDGVKAGYHNMKNELTID